MSEQAYPEPTVGALIFNNKGKIFLMKSHKWNGKYVLPGGHIEVGERMEATLQREVKEETGLDIDRVEYIGFQEFIFDDAFWKKRHFLFFDFACRAKTGTVVLNNEGQEYCWVALSDIDTLPVEPYSRKAIKQYQELQIRK